MTLAAQVRLAGDWATILQSEQAALAVDREVQEAMLRLAAGLAQQAATLHGRPPHGQPADAASGPAGADAAPRSPAVDDASAASAAPPDAAAPDTGPPDAGRGLAGLG